MTPIYLGANNTNNVLRLENFFEIQVDGEIGQELCEIIRKDNVQRGKVSWLDKIIDCPEIIGDVGINIYPYDDQVDDCE